MEGSKLRNMIIFFQKHKWFFTFACHVVAFELTQRIFHTGTYTWKYAAPFCLVGWQVYKISEDWLILSLSGMDKIIEWRKNKNGIQYKQILALLFLPFLHGIGVLLCGCYSFIFSALVILIGSCLFFRIRFAWAWQNFVDFFSTKNLEKQQNALRRLKKSFWNGALENTKNLKYEEKRKLAKNMLQGNLSKTMVAKLTGLTLLDIESIEKTM